MNITSTTVTKIAEEVTQQAKFSIEYSIHNEQLQRVQVNIYKPAEGTEYEYVGFISIENGNYYCNLPTNSNVAYYFTEVDKYLDKIEKETQIVDKSTD